MLLPWDHGVATGVGAGGGYHCAFRPKCSTGAQKQPVLLTPTLANKSAEAKIARLSQWHNATSQLLMSRAPTFALC